MKNPPSWQEQGSPAPVPSSFLLPCSAEMASVVLITGLWGFWLGAHCSVLQVRGLPAALQLPDPLSPFPCVPAAPCSVWWDAPAHPFSLSQAEPWCHSRESHPPHPSRCSHPRISLLSFPRNQHNLLAFGSSSPSSDRNTPSSLHLWQDYLF